MDNQANHAEGEDDGKLTGSVTHTIVKKDAGYEGKTEGKSNHLQGMVSLGIEDQTDCNH